MTKMTYVAALNYVLTNTADLPTEVAEKLTALRDQQVKRNATERKPTAKQLANADLMDEVRTVLRNAPDPLTVTEIMGRSATLSALSNQKVSALIRCMGAEVVKEVDKRVSKFRLA